MDLDNTYDWSFCMPNEIPMSGKWVNNWFSNMIIQTMIIDKVFYNSVENYYQAQKTVLWEEQKVVIAATPHNSKRLGRKVTLRDDWEDIKENVMERALRCKFSVQSWKDKLLETGESPIVEWNNWNDKYWGASIKDGMGRNRLGVILMKLRKEYQEE